MKLITDLLEAAASRSPGKIALIDEHGSITYEALLLSAKRIASTLAGHGIFRAPVALFLEKGIRCVSAMLGAAYSGNFYIVLDTQTPAPRLRAILDILQPGAMLTTADLAERAAALEFDGPIMTYEAALETALDEPALQAIHRELIDTDLLYCLFTSGSTGQPKGAAVSHRSVIAYTRWAAETFHFSPSSIFGNQTPLYFSMSVTDLYGALCAGATLVFIPKAYFAFPGKLAEFLNRHRVNTIYWVPSAMAAAVNTDLFRYCRLEALTTVLFAGEVMPAKYLNYWRSHYPDALFANLFGPTEATDICSYYVVDRDFDPSEPIPIGRACNNCALLVLDESGRPCPAGQAGQLYIRGSFLAAGYYNDPSRTADAFVQNPCQHAYPETVYKTGDLVRYNDRGELLYLGRADHQIKHMGYRIELGEIEAAASAISGVAFAACVYDSAGSRLILFYEGEAETKTLADGLRRRLPHYMQPGVIVPRRPMPRNQNGKIDRKALQALVEAEIGG